MKKVTGIVVAIAAILFLVPFFWLPQGFVDLGGDAGRLYFLDPSATIQSILQNSHLYGPSMYAIIPYEFFLSVLKKFIISPTYMISMDHGIQLSLGFLSIYFIVKELLKIQGAKDKGVQWVSIVSGIAYIGFITKTGWVLSLETHNQIFLYPLIFYLLLRFCLTSKFFYAVVMLFLSILYSGNFSFSSMPQLMAFFPMMLCFLVIVLAGVLRRSIPVRGLFTLFFLFVGIHAFHIVPTIASIIDKGPTYSYIFSDQSIQYSGVHYFQVNHQALGKISSVLFQPSSQSIFILLVPVLILLGFLHRPSKLLGILGIFFATTLFLVSANITHVGVGLYEKLFYIPGFMMFRSFHDKWYNVFVFFYTLLFAVSFHSIIQNKKQWVVIALSILITGSTLLRILPFLKGKAIDVPHYQSNSVSPLFKIDPDLLSAISFVKTLPKSGNVLTLPLTFPYYQIAYGKEGGAYVGVSLVLYLTGKPDYPGFWSFGQYAQPMFDAIGDEDTGRIVELLSHLGVRYVFYNSDQRVIDNFPGYPYIYPGLMYSSKEQLPAIQDQTAYKKFLTTLPLKKIYTKGFYSIYEMDYPSGQSVELTQPPNARVSKYLSGGLIITAGTLGIVVLLSIIEFFRKNHEKK